eukprot:1148881-Pelagomonas_calceolata.AAC.7
MMMTFLCLQPHCAQCDTLGAVWQNGEGKMLQSFSSQLFYWHVLTDMRRKRVSREPWAYRQICPCWHAMKKGQP